MRTQTQMRSLLVALVALVAALAIGACGDDDESSSGDTSGDTASGGTIAFLLPETQTARYEALDKPEFEAKVAELCPDCDIYYQNADQDPAKQQQQVEAAITEGVDVMVLDPVDSTTAGALATQVKAADIPVISYDRLILDADLDYYVEFDSVEVGRQQATALSEKLAEDGNDTGPIIKINGDPKDNNASLFDEGSDEVLEQEGVEVAQEFDTPDWLAENAQREMEQAITAVGKEEIKGVYAANDGTAGGAIAAMKAAGIDPQQVPVTGQDAELTAIQRILAGEQFMTVYKPYQDLATGAAELAVAIANGEEPAADLVTDEIDNGTEAVPSAVFDTIVVTKDNVEDTIIADDVYPVSEICAGQYASACKEAGIS